MSRQDERVWVCVGCGVTVDGPNGNTGDHKPECPYRFVGVLKGYQPAPFDGANAKPLEAEVERLRDIIGRLYMGRGGTRQELYVAIKHAFRDMNAGGES